jgi:hypothetical protein
VSSSPGASHAPATCASTVACRRPRCCPTPPTRP